MCLTEPKNTCGAKGETVRQTIFETVGAPRLVDINATDFVTFKEKRSIFERMIKEKNKDVSVQIPLTTYRDTIEESILELFIIANWAQATSVENVTEDQIRACIEKLARVDEKDYDMGIIEQDIISVSMERPRRGANLEKQVWRLCLKYTTTLNKCGYEKFVEKKPKIAIRHVFKRISDKRLKSRMRMILDLRKEKFKNDFHKFVRQLAEEARTIDLQELARRYRELTEEEDTDEDAPIQRYRHKKKSMGRRGDPKRREGNPRERGDEHTGNSKPDTRNPQNGKPHKHRFPNCLNPKCEGEHFIRDCPKTPEAEKRRLKADYHECKRRKKTDGYPSGKIGKIATKNIDDHTSLFSASFYDGAVESVAMADQGSDANFLSPALLGDLLKADLQLNVTILRKPKAFDNALQSAAPIRCSKVVQATVRIRVRHGGSLSLANVKWFVADDELDCIYIGRHVLAAIGLDNCKLLAIACDRNNGYIDIEEAMREAGTLNEVCAGAAAGSICGILSTHRSEYGSTFHSQGDEGSDFLQDSDVYVDLGEDTPEKLDETLASQVEKARSNGLTDINCARLKDLLGRYRSIFGCGWENPHQPLSNQ